MVDNLILSNALKFGPNWPTGILELYAELSAQRADRDGELPPEQETTYQQLHQWLITTIIAGTVSRGAEWLDG